MSSKVVTIIDYGIGNTGSVANMIKKIGGTSIVSSDHDIISKAEKLILVGVGSFDDGMNKLKQHKLIELLEEKVLVQKTPIIGICLGMQLLSESSEEGTNKGLGFIKGKVVKFKPLLTAKKCLRIPHMGWNRVFQKKDSRLMADLPKEPRFYFVHSYHFVTQDNSDILTETAYGNMFTSAIERDNIIGVQFHPEKSHKFGMRLLENFINNY